MNADRVSPIWRLKWQPANRKAAQSASVRSPRVVSSCDARVTPTKPQHVTATASQGFKSERAAENGLNGVDDAIDIIPFSSCQSQTSLRTLLDRSTRDLRRRCGGGRGGVQKWASESPSATGRRKKSGKTVALCNALLSSPGLGGHALDDAQGLIRNAAHMQSGFECMHWVSWTASLSTGFGFRECG